MVGVGFPHFVIGEIHDVRVVPFIPNQHILAALAIQNIVSDVTVEPVITSITCAVQVFSTLQMQVLDVFRQRERHGLYTESIPPFSSSDTVSVNQVITLPELRQRFVHWLL